MRALVFDGALRLAKDRPRPQAGPGEALVRVSLVGICNTDLEIMRGYMGFHGVLGHEFVGTVESAPDPTWVGRRVVGEINCACGCCPTCRAGRLSHCPSDALFPVHHLQLGLRDLVQIQTQQVQGDATHHDGIKDLGADVHGRGRRLGAVADVAPRHAEPLIDCLGYFGGHKVEAIGQVRFLPLACLGPLLAVLPHDALDVH